MGLVDESDSSFLKAFPYDAFRNEQKEFFVREVKDKRMRRMVLSSSSGGVTFLLKKMILGNL